MKTTLEKAKQLLNEVNGDKNKALELIQVVKDKLKDNPIELLTKMPFLLEIEQQIKTL